MAQSPLVTGNSYEDRNIKGTGIETDPWIIGELEKTETEMFKNLLDAVYTIDAYVKLIKDIDCSKSEEYRGGIDHSLYFRCAKFYSEKNGDERPAIKNLIIKNQYAFETNGAQALNIKFLNIYHVGSNTLTSEFIHRTSGNPEFQYCDFSGLTNAQKKNSIFNSANINFTSCAINYTIKNYEKISDLTIFNGQQNAPFNMCQIHYNGPIYSYSYETGANGIFITYAKKTAITGILKIQPETEVFTCIFKECDGCYFSGMIQSEDQENKHTIYKSVSQSSFQDNLICTELPEDESITMTTVSNNIITTITPENLKSKEYLYNIGFLP